MTLVIPGLLILLGMLTPAFFDDRPKTKKPETVFISYCLHGARGEYDLVAMYEDDTYAYQHIQYRKPRRKSLGQFDWSKFNLTHK